MRRSPPRSIGLSRDVRATAPSWIGWIISVAERSAIVEIFFPKKHIINFRNATKRRVLKRRILKREGKRPWERKRRKIPTIW